LELEEHWKDLSMPTDLEDVAPPSRAKTIAAHALSALGKVRNEFLSIFRLTTLSLVHRRAHESLLQRAIVPALAPPCLSIAPLPSPAKVAVDRVSHDDGPRLGHSVLVRLNRSGTLIVKPTTVI
jgi:hypothetical protein